MISSPRSSLIYLSDPIHRSDPDILHLADPNDEQNNSKGETSSLSSIRPPFLKNAFQIHKSRPLSPRDGEEIWLPMEAKRPPGDCVDFHSSTLTQNGPKFFQDPLPRSIIEEDFLLKAHRSSRIAHDHTISFQRLASEESSYATKSLPLIPQSARFFPNYPSSEDSLLAGPSNHSSKNSEKVQSITDLWSIQPLKSKEKLRRKKDGYRNAFTTGLVTVAVTLCLTFLVLYWNYSETLHRRQTKKAGLILDHWGKKAPSKEELRKLIEENRSDSSSSQSTTPKISRRDNSVVYIDS